MAAPLPHTRPDPPARAGSVADCCPGFCTRCDRHALVRLGTGEASLDALCPACRAAEKRDRAAPRASRFTAGWAGTGTSRR